jgi:hypothetical protein
MGRVGWWAALAAGIAIGTELAFGRPHRIAARRTLDALGPVSQPKVTAPRGSTGV